MDQISSKAPVCKSTPPSSTKTHIRPATRALNITPRNNKPKLLFMGLKRSGKTSISSVVCGGMPPSETLFLEPTTTILNSPMGLPVDLELWEVPGQLNVRDSAFNLKDIIRNQDVLVWVIDAQDDYYDTVCLLHFYIIAIRSTYPNIDIEIFIHKVDSLSDDYQRDIQEDIMYRTREELRDNELDDVHISYHLTSIYDHSILEAFSKVIQKVFQRLETVETVTDLLCRSCSIQKAFLFDATRRFYIATDSSPTDSQIFSICCDYIDFVDAMSDIYGKNLTAPETTNHTSPEISTDTNNHTPGRSVLKLHTGMVIYSAEINRYFKLVCVVDQETAEKLPMIDFNIDIFRKSLQKVFDYGQNELT